ncbi:MAG: hypothetical protein Q8927_07080 [Bacteroidota bacterium]|nr:hypothetical protein [Bacteroidota bacterium]
MKLPDPPDALQEREANEKAALAPTRIPANKYYRPLPPLAIAAAAAIARREMDSSAYFREAQARNGEGKEKVKKDISLLLDDAWQERKREAQEDGRINGEGRKNGAFAVANHAYEQKRVDADLDLKEVNEERKKNVLQDPYIQIAYQLLASMEK